MAEKVQLEIEVKGGDSVGKASTKVESLRKQLKDMKAELASGTLSGAAFEELAAKAGKLQDRIGDVNQRVKNLASDSGKLDAFVSVATGIAGGFAAAQGAIALFGDENEDLQKTLIKVQGAVAVLNGFQAVANTLNKDSAASTLLLGNANLFNSVKTAAASAATTLYTFATTGATAATKAFRIALLATGIGAIVVLIGALVSAMANMGDETEETTEKIKRQNEALEKHKELVAGEADDYIKNRSAREGGLNDMKRQLDLLKARGASAKQVYEQERKIRNQELKDLQYQLAYNVGNAKLEQELKQKIKDNETAQEAARLNLERVQREEAAKKRLELLKKENKDIKQEQQDAQVEAYKEWKAQQDLETANLFAELEYQMEHDAETERVNKEHRDRELAADREYKLAQLNAELSLNNARRDALDAGFSIAQQFAGKNKALADSIFAIQKGVAIAQVIIDTQKEIAGIYANPTLSALPDAGIAVKTALATGAKIRAATSIATIAATAIGKFAGSGGGGGSSSGGGGSRPTNSAPDIQGFQTNNVPQQTGSGGQPIKVFVTETDIRNVGNKTDSIYNQATVE